MVDALCTHNTRIYPSIFRKDTPPEKVLHAYVRRFILTYICTQLHAYTYVATVQLKGNVLSARYLRSSKESSASIC